jgi:predicted amidophosphoribosyltransferase
MLIMSIKKNFKLAKLSYVSNHALMIDDIYSNGKTVTKNLVVTCLNQYHYLN